MTILQDSVRRPPVIAVLSVFLIAASLAIYLFRPEDSSRLCDGASLDGDTLFFIKEVGQKYAAASLLCTPRATPELSNAARDTSYHQDTYFV